MPSPLNIGIVGCGAIGSALAVTLQQPAWRRDIHVIGIHDRDRARAFQLAQQLGGVVPLLSLTMLIHRSHLIIEATSATAAAAIVRRALTAGRDVIALSVGGLLPLISRWPRLARGAGRLFIPSGAVAGVDALNAARLGVLHRVTLTTRKPPQAFLGAPGIRRQRALSRLTRPMMLFQGSAARAVRAFPQNINVAATVALAGLGARRTIVRVIADPTVHRNIHELDVVGTCGRITARAENVPSPINPKTSELAILSALATLQQMVRTWRVGT